MGVTKDDLSKVFSIRAMHLNGKESIFSIRVVSTFLEFLAKT